MRGVRLEHDRSGKTRLAQGVHEVRMVDRDDHVQGTLAGFAGDRACTESDAYTVTFGKRPTTLAVVLREDHFRTTPTAKLSCPRQQYGLDASEPAVRI